MYTYIVFYIKGKKEWLIKSHPLNSRNPKVKAFQYKALTSMEFSGKKRSLLSKYMV